MKNIRYKFKIYKHGFTLAEVLITLVIIGVVAALTIPTAINRMQREELRSQFKKAYSATAQAVQKMKIDYGDTVYDMNSDTAASFRNRFMQYFSLSCSDNCVVKSNYKNYTNDANEYLENHLSDNFIAQDGAVYGFSKGNASNVLYITIDVNGLKNPNRWGYDVFTFYISNNDLKPCEIGVPTHNITCGSVGLDGNLNGAGCAAKAIFDKDYFKNLP